MWNFSNVLRNAPFFCTFRILKLFSILLYSCPVFRICWEYPVLVLLYLMSWICSLYLVLKFRPARAAHRITKGTWRSDPRYGDWVSDSHVGGGGVRRGGLQRERSNPGFFVALLMCCKMRRVIILLSSCHFSQVILLVCFGPFSSNACYIKLSCTSFSFCYVCKQRWTLSWTHTESPVHQGATMSEPLKWWVLSCMSELRLRVAPFEYVSTPVSADRLWLSRSGPLQA
jgi:hypothetical protein